MPGVDAITRDAALRAGETGFARRIWAGLVRVFKGGAKDDAGTLGRDVVSISRQAVKKIRASTEAVQRALAVDATKQAAQQTVKDPQQVQELKNLIYLEAFVNDQRYAGKKSITFPANYPWTPEKGPYPQLWAMIPLEDVKIFARGEKVELPSHLQGLVREVEVAGKKGPEKKKFVFFPIHWQQKDMVGKEYPVIQDGLARVSASVRVVYLDPHTPSRFGDFTHTSIKMHLDDVKGADTPISGGLGGHRRIDAVWAEMSPVITEVMEHMVRQKKFSPLVEVVPEALSMVEKNNRGVIFRTVPQGEVFPAFSLYSPLPAEGKNGLKLGVLGGKTPTANVLAVDLLENLRVKNPGMGKLDAFRELFVDPVLDVNLSMFKEGMALELHPQNFLFRFDSATGRVKSIVVRDLHGFNYSADYRAKMGLPDLMNPDFLQQLGFPRITRETLKAYFESEGAVRSRFRSPAIFENTHDFFSSMWYFHTLDSLEKTGYLSRQEVLQAVEMIKDRLEFFARKYSFDLSLLRPPTKVEEFVADPSTGIRYKILFRRPVQKE